MYIYEIWVIKTRLDCSICYSQRENDGWQPLRRLASSFPTKTTTTRRSTTTKTMLYNRYYGLRLFYFFFFFTASASKSSPQERPQAPQTHWPNPRRSILFLSLIFVCFFNLFLIYGFLRISLGLRFGTAFLVFKSEIWVENYFLENGFRDFQGVLLFFFLFFHCSICLILLPYIVWLLRKPKEKKNRECFGVLKLKIDILILFLVWEILWGLRFWHMLSFEKRFLFWIWMTREKIWLLRKWKEKKVKRNFDFWIFHCVGECIESIQLSNAHYHSV